MRAFWIKVWDPFERKPEGPLGSQSGPGTSSHVQDSEGFLKSVKFRKKRRGSEKSQKYSFMFGLQHIVHTKFVED